MIIIMIITTMIMTEKARNGSEYTTISVLPSTKTRLAQSMPKSWDWDRVLNELAEMWENQQGKGSKSGKSAQNNPTS